MRSSAQPFGRFAQQAINIVDAAKKGNLAAIANELLGLFMDDGWLALGIVIWVFGAWFVEGRHVLASVTAGVLFTAGLAGVLTASAVRRARV